MHFPAYHLATTEKVNQTQEKQTCIHNKIYYNSNTHTKKLKPDLVTYHNLQSGNGVGLFSKITNKKHLKNVGPIHHCEPPHTNSPDVASGTVARRLHIDVQDANNNDNDDNDNDDNA